VLRLLEPSLPKHLREEIALRVSSAFEYVAKNQEELDGTTMIVGEDGILFKNAMLLALYPFFGVAPVEFIGVPPLPSFFVDLAERELAQDSPL